MENIDSWKIYYQMIKERCKQLIDSGIWKGIDMNQYLAWLNNFKTIEEQTFAALILDSLIFRSNDHVVSMLEDVFSRILHNIWRIKKDPLYNSINPLMMLKERHGNHNLRIVAAKSLDGDNNVSADYINHIIYDELQIRQMYGCDVQKIKEQYENGIRCFLIVDECSLSGTQLDEFLSGIHYNDYPEARFYVILCTAHYEAIKMMKNRHPSIEILYAEYLDNSDGFFEEIPYPDLGLATKEEAIELYKQLLRSKNINDPNTLGYLDMALTYAFSNCTPNDSLPILSYESRTFKNLTHTRKS